jgi:shikimate kinase
VSIVLIGLPASGKSTAAARVARSLGLGHADSDTFVEAAAGKPIGDIFAEDGEAAFRSLEVEAVAAVLALPDTVVSLGGGAILAEANRRALQGHEVMWLDVSVATATRRAGLAQLRPLLLGHVREHLAVLDAERRPLYRAVATHRIDGNHRTAAEVAHEILRLTGRQGAVEPVEAEPPVASGPTADAAGGPGAEPGVEREHRADAGLGFGPGAGGGHE